MLADPAKAPLIEHLRNDKGEWVERDDVWVYDINEFGTRKGNLSFVTVHTPGSNEGAG
jgi:hypothetical protein